MTFYVSGEGVTLCAKEWNALFSNISIAPLWHSFVDMQFQSIERHTQFLYYTNIVHLYLFLLKSEETQLALRSIPPFTYGLSSAVDRNNIRRKELIRPKRKLRRVLQAIFVFSSFSFQFIGEREDPSQLDASGGRILSTSEGRKCKK